MSDTTTLLLKLINEGKTINEISEILGISNKKIYNILTTIKGKGFEFDRKYYYNGDIVYLPKLSFIEKQYKGIDIITELDNQKFEAIVISDLHIGSAKERLDSLNSIYDYCAKEGIHIIIVCGDIIDGMYGPYEKRHNNINEQIDYALKNYPFDKNILNFVTLGDHDYNSLKNHGQNLARVFESYRHDIVVLGYCIGQINIKNDIIYVRHPSDKFNEVKLSPMYKCLMLNGHSHKMGIRSTNNVTTVTVPTLSDLTCPTEAQLPTAIRMSLEFKNGMINYGTFSQLMVTNQVYRLNEFQCHLGYGKDMSGNIPVRLEEKPKKRILESPKNGDIKNQIDKFNARWKI